MDAAQAKAHFEQCMQTPWFDARPAEVKALYIAYPPWKLYTNPDGTCARRVLGVCEYTMPDGKTELRLEVVTCMLGYVNRVIGGVQARGRCGRRQLRRERDYPNKVTTDSPGLPVSRSRGLDELFRAHWLSVTFVN